jgi:hypothetical protein
VLGFPSASHTSDKQRIEETRIIDQAMMVVPRFLPLRPLATWMFHRSLGKLTRQSEHRYDAQSTVNRVTEITFESVQVAFRFFPVRRE